MDLPDSQNNLEALALGRGEDVLRSVALAAGVSADKGRQVLQVVKVELVVLGRLAVAIGELVTQRKAQSAAGGDHCGSSGQNNRKKARNTHDVLLGMW